MSRSRRPAVWILPLVVVIGCTAEIPAGTASPTAAGCPEDGAAFADAKLYIEHNATDGDTGVHALLAAEGWTQLCVVDPDGVLLLRADPTGALGELGLADLLWESREPAEADYAIEDLQADFPEGTYRVGGIDVEGNPLAGRAHFTHDVPAAPVITAPADLAEDPDAGEVPLAPADLVIRWEPVTQTLDGRPVAITAYEVIVTDDAAEDPHGLSRPVYDVHVRPDVTALPVPAAFLAPGTVYELEVLAIEESGNQTISLGFFRTP